jgi:hypothetical protein
MDHENEMLCVLAAICCGADGGGFASRAVRAVDMAEAILAEVQKRHPVHGDESAR